MAILNVPIQLNRGTPTPFEVTNLPLSEGEPYFNLSNNTLYIKSSSSIDINISGYSGQTRKLEFTNPQLFTANATNSKLNVGGFSVHPNTTNTQYIFSPGNSNNVITISDFKIDALRSIILRSYSSSTTLGPGVYGTKSQMESIKNPHKGQLFFALA